nr:hypothetical protein [Microbacterium ulmi]
MNEPEEVADVAAEAPDAGIPPQYGVGPFSIREVAIAGIWLVAFVVSFFPVTATWTGTTAAIRLTWGSVWTSGLPWVLTIAVPTVAVFLLVLRRLSPQGIRRVGSLGIDQFASVAFSVATVVWLGWVWDTVAFAAGSGIWTRSWVMWVEFALMIAGVVLTVFAPVIPPLAEDFEHRPEVVAHRSARPIRAVSPRPTPTFSAFAEPSPTEAPGYAYDAGDPAEPAEPESAEYGLAGDQEDWKPLHTRNTFDDVEPEQATVRHQAFWALAPEERDVVDESGIPIFRIGPTAWALVIEDRGDSFVVRHEDGRLGYLLDVRGVTRG